MTVFSIRTAISSIALALLATGCVTAPPQPQSYAAYTPTELIGESSEQLRSKLKDFLNQPFGLHRNKPIMILHEPGDLRQLEVGEDYVFMRFDRARIMVTEPRRDEYDVYAFLFERLPELRLTGETCLGPWVTLLDGGVTFTAPPGPQWCDVLYTLGLRAQRQRDADAARFAQLAAQPRPAASAMPENLRRLIVQAEAQRQDKAYAAAAATFRKVIRQEPVAYPAAYFNLALLYEIQRDYPRAIESMRRYLLLQPQAADARAAQDKIYEWEMRAAQR